MKHCSACHTTKEEVMSEVLTLEEVAATWDDEGLEWWQKRANFDWLCKQHEKLKEGGVLAIPNTWQVFIKKGPGFIEK